jgi:hypothetical protein
MRSIKTIHQETPFESQERPWLWRGSPRTGC